MAAARRVRRRDARRGRAAAGRGARPFAHGLHLTASIGICDLASAPGADTLTERGDQALCWAKARGRDAALRWTAAPAAHAARANSLSETANERIDALARIADDADPTPGGGHGRRVADLSVALAACVDWSPTQARWVRHHHERWDGAGCPDGPGGLDIPDGARVLALADAWHAMTTDRPYRAALGAEEALAEVERRSAGQFMPGAGGLLRDALKWWDAAA